MGCKRMNEEEKLSLLIDERTELIPHETVYDKVEIEQNHTDSVEVLLEPAIQQERMSSEAILREIAEEEELEEEYAQAVEEVKIFKYIVHTIKFHEGDAITLYQLRNICAHSEAKLSPDDLDEVLNDYIEAGYIRIEDDKIYITFLGEHVNTLL